MPTIEFNVNWSDFIKRYRDGGLWIGYDLSKLLKLCNLSYEQHIGIVRRQFPHLTHVGYIPLEGAARLWIRGELDEFGSRRYTFSKTGENSSILVSQEILADMISWEYIERMSDDTYRVGIFRMKVTAYDPLNGRFRLEPVALPEGNSEQVSDSVLS